MNLHKKLTEIGFKRCEFHKPEHDYSTGRYTMVLDDFITETKRIHNGNSSKLVTTKMPKRHPKWNYFWKLSFSENITIWAKVIGHNDVTLFLESDKIKEGVMVLYGKDSSIWRKYNTSGNNEDKDFKIISKGDIIKLLPKEVQRDILLNSIFD